MYNSLFFWLIIAIIAALFEMGHPGLFYFLSFSIGACITALSSLWICTITLQLYIFIAATICAFLLLRHLLAHYLTTNLHYRSNMHALIGKHATVIKAIDAGQVGSVKIGGELWAARALDDKISMLTGERVIITQVSGAHLKVQKQ
jgi:membrane protein implicated in regulation of membrane protease activity